METVALAGRRARYVAADAGDDFERERLGLLGRLMNPMTTRHLERLGIERGWRCLEVGAGGGSVARWLARRVGPRGHVVATDLNPRFLGGLRGSNVEVRRHDILHDDLETSHYDLVHCRALLMHLPEPERALARMVAALRPGGWLLVEEGDLDAFTGVDPIHPASAMVDRFHRLTTEALQALCIDLHFGRRCPDLLERLGLAEVGAERTALRLRGGDAETRFGRMSLDLLFQGTSVISQAQYEEVQRAFAEPSFAFRHLVMVGAWGRRVAEAS